MDSCFWVGSIEEFSETETPSLMSSLRRGHQTCCNELASDSQESAWRTSIKVLKKATDRVPSKWACVFEYILPREKGRRPDFLLLTPNTLLVLEFKDYQGIHSAHIEQVSAYARDLAEYQSACRHLQVVPMLVLTRAANLRKAINGVEVCSQEILGDVLLSILGSDPGTSPDIQAFLAGDYAPLPSIISAARLLFQDEPMPQIRRAESAGIPETLRYMHSFADEAVASGKKALILVTGVPGAGKTLVGLQFVYDRSDGNEAPAVFLSGNGPLVEVLQYTLQNRVFVQDVHAFLKQYGGGSRRLPKESVWIYDEAQRAWDDQRSKEKRGADSVSEPKDFLRLGSRANGGVVIVGLIGEGQEIHLGEEGGIEQWNDAIADSSETWTVTCPTHLRAVFTAANMVVEDDRLNLTKSLRTHRASDLQTWVDRVLNGRLDEAAVLAENLAKDGYSIYLTRRLDSAVRHAKERYLGFEDKRYGLLASHKAKNLERYGVPNTFNATRAVKKGPWFGDSPSSPMSSCQCSTVATEFACQGLELDFPVVAWGDDLTWNPSELRWESSTGRSKAVDPHRLRINSYRVLLTRGRDGMVIFVPDEEQMTPSHEALVRAGCKQFATL